MKREDFEALLSTELGPTEAEAVAVERQRSAFLTRFGTASGVVATIDAILADEVWLEEVAHDSCRHALGFDKLVLLKCGDAGQLRLHVWWTAGRRAGEHIHGHRFLFESVLVTGRLSTELFAEDPAGLRCDAYRESSTEASRSGPGERTHDDLAAADSLDAALVSCPRSRRRSSADERPSARVRAVGCSGNPVAHSELAPSARTRRDGWGCRPCMRGRRTSSPRR